MADNQSRDLNNDFRLVVFTFLSFQQLCIEEIKAEVKDRNVLALLSGGVDSTVLAALLTKALGKFREPADQS